MLLFIDAVINDMIETTNQRIKTMNKSLEEKEKLIAELEAIIEKQEQQKKQTLEMIPDELMNIIYEYDQFELH
jgi:septal ring factor EnvC (AmiA/AmiB activator)